MTQRVKLICLKIKENNIKKLLDASKTYSLLPTTIFKVFYTNKKFFASYKPKKNMKMLKRNIYI